MHMRAYRYGFGLRQFIGDLVAVAATTREQRFDRVLIDIRYCDHERHTGRFQHDPATYAGRCQYERNTHADEFRSASKFKIPAAVSSMERRVTSMVGH